ncbi:MULTISPECIES: hypothetical protein [Halomonadaceae]|uniref:LolA family protein n=1 Tax=Halomonadaceae TaxID=28256 RepID=UPI00159B437F|nr:MULTISPECIES: hypothetical protein [Halomonas]QJQ95793.1 hypothetical protein HIO72_11280 [Halomonas sp. PA5]
MLLDSLPRRLPLTLAMVGLGLSFSLQAFEIDDLQRHLAIPDWLHGNFEQRHWLEERQTRLYSDGRFLYQRGQQLVLHFVTPEEEVVILHRAQEGDEAQTGGTLPQEDNGTDELPTQTELGHLIDLLGSDWNRMSAYYAMRLEGGPDDWQLLLSPRAPVLDAMLSDLRLTGGTSWERLELKALNGNELVIEFSQVSPAVDETLAIFLGEWLARDIEARAIDPDGDEESLEEERIQDSAVEEEDVMAEEVPRESLESEEEQDGENSA